MVRVDEEKLRLSERKLRGRERELGEFLKRWEGRGPYTREERVVIVSLWEKKR